MRLSIAAATLVAIASIPAWSQPSLDEPVCPAGSGFLFCGRWQLKPDSAEWLPLLAPLGQNVVGTPAADALAAGGEGDVVNGLRGSDSLVSSFHRTALIGERGADELTTDATAPADLGLVVQIGGRDGDVHRATLLDGPVEIGSVGEVLLDLGSGDDVAEANVFDTNGSESETPDGNLASAQIFGHDGDDVIDTEADTQNDFGNSLAINAVDGGGGDDQITMRAVTEFDGARTIADNRVSAGDGDDVVDATAINWPNDPILASNVLLGGRGDDVLRAFMLTDSNSSGSIGVNELWGGKDDDELEAIHDTDGENFITDLTTVLEGEKGNDSLRAESKAWGENVVTSHRLKGGPGDDALTLLLDLRLSDGSDANESINVLDGGPGRDHLDASVTATPDPFNPCDEPPCDFVPRAQNHLSGGAKNDVLVASIGPDVTGASFLKGGRGDDELTVSGGSDNELDGGDGSDSLFVGDGDDRLTGGESRDTFHFDLSSDQGSDSVVDFQSRRDVMSFAGIVDSGAPGLADDLDAISSILDLGPANDVVIDLAIGTRIIFVGRGTGAVDSWADIAPPQALGTWTPAATVASVAAARAVRSFEAERALLPRDH